MKTDRDRLGLGPADEGIGVLRDCSVDGLFELLTREAGRLGYRLETTPR